MLKTQKDIFFFLLVCQLGKWQYIFLSCAHFFPKNLPSQVILVCLLWVCMCIFSKLSLRTKQIAPYKNNQIMVLGDGLLQILLPIGNMIIATPCLALCCYTSPILSAGFIAPQNLFTLSSKGQNKYHTTLKCYLT